MVVGRASSKYGEAEGVAAGSGCGRGLGCRGRAAEGVSALLAAPPKRTTTRHNHLHDTDAYSKGHDKVQLVCLIIRFNP